jgi:hypothetical protein
MCRFVFAYVIFGRDRSRELSFMGATEAVTLSPKFISMIHFNTDCYVYIKWEALLNGAK